MRVTDPTEEWRAHSGEDLARRIDIALALEPSTGAILDAVAEWMSDVEITHAAALGGRSSQLRALSWARDEVHRVSQDRRWGRPTA